MMMIYLKPLKKLIKNYFTFYLKKSRLVNIYYLTEIDIYHHNNKNVVVSVLLFAYFHLTVCKQTEVKQSRKRDKLGKKQNIFKNPASPHPAGIKKGRHSAIPFLSLLPTLRPKGARAGFNTLI
jgi:D-hexose-6-phosphate mutarotase